MSDKLEIMELVSKYLLCLDEKRFDYESMSKIFTENAEMIIPSSTQPQRICRGLKEIRDTNAALFMQTKSCHHQSSDFMFVSHLDNMAEVICKLLSCYDFFGGKQEASLLTGTINFSVKLADEGWRICKLVRKVKSAYMMSVFSPKTHDDFFM